MLLYAEHWLTFQIKRRLFNIRFVLHGGTWLPRKDLSPSNSRHIGVPVVKTITVSEVD